MACSGNAWPLTLLFIQMDVSNAIPSYSYRCAPIRPRQRRRQPYLCPFNTPPQAVPLTNNALIALQQAKHYLASVRAH